MLPRREMQNSKASTAFVWNVFPCTHITYVYLLLRWTVAANPNENTFVQLENRYKVLKIFTNHVCTQTKPTRCKMEIINAAIQVDATIWWFAANGLDWWFYDRWFFLTFSKNKEIQCQLITCFCQNYSWINRIAQWYVQFQFTERKHFWYRATVSAHAY